MNRSHALLLVLAGLSTQSLAATFHVSRTGIDTNPGTSAAPFRTVQRGVNALKAGDTLLIRGGTYDGRVVVNTASGTATAPITVQAYAGERVTLTFTGGNRTTWKNGRSTMALGGVAFWVFRKLTLTNESPDERYPPKSQTGGDRGGNSSPVGAWGATDILFEDVEITSVGGGGLWCDASSKRFTFRRVRAHDVGWRGYDRPHGHGLYLNGSGHVIEDSELDHNAYFGLQLYPQVEGVTVRRTRLHDNGASGAYVGSGGGTTFSRNHTFVNCVFARNGLGAGVSDANAAGVTSGRSASGTRILNSTLVGNRLALVSPSAANVAEFGNNIVVAGSPARFVAGSFGVVVRNNLFFGPPGSSMPGGAGTAALWGDPRFSAMSTSEFRLNAGSPAIDTGANLGAVAGEDLLRVRRPQGAGYDVGAFEYVAPIVDPPPPPTGKVFVVSTSGVDTVTCGTAAAPCRTITFAYGKAGAGETVLVKPGTYTDFTNGYGLRLHRSGTASAPITIKSETKWGAILDAKSDPVRANGVYFTGAFNVFENFQVINAYHTGVVIYGTSNTIRGNRLFRNGTAGSPSSSYGHGGVFSASGSRGTTFIGNLVSASGRATCGGKSSCNLDHGLYLCGDDELIANNVVIDSSANGLQIAGYETVTNMRVFNNTFARNGTEPWHGGILLWKRLDNVRIENNIIYGSPNGVTSYAAHGTGVIVENNLFAGLTGRVFLPTEANSDYTFTANALRTGDPKFLNLGASDFRLRSGSAALDVGTALSAVATDHDGVSRPQGAGLDLGAFERRVGPAAPSLVVR